MGGTECGEEMQDKSKYPYLSGTEGQGEYEADVGSLNIGAEEPRSSVWVRCECRIVMRKCQDVICSRYVVKM